MNIEDLQTKKTEYESKLTNIINDHIENFKIETGVDISFIDIRLIDINTVSGNNEKYKPCEVRISIVI